MDPTPTPKKKPYRIAFVLNVLPPLSTEVETLDDRLMLDRCYHEIRQLIALVLGDERPSEPLERARVKFTRFDSLIPGHWELVKSFTPVRQALCGEKVLRFAAFEFAEYDFRKVPRELGCIEVVVEEI